MKKIPNSQLVTKAILKEELITLETRIDKKFELYNERQEKRFLELKDYMYNLVDAVIMEIKDMRAEHTAQVGQIPAIRVELEDHGDRIEKLEKKVAKAA